MARITISKRKQPAQSKALSKGKTFYRVKIDGVFLEDFKTKSEATRFANRIRKRKR